MALQSHSRSIFLIAVGAAVSLLADVQYEQTSRVTGGSLANMPLVGSKLKEPQTTLHMVKGNRMAMVTKDLVMIYDLDKETITSVQNERKEFSVLTFAEMREAMDKAMQKLQQATSPRGSAEMTWSVKVSDTGETRNVNGFDARKYIVTLDGSSKDPKSGKTMGTRMVMDSWMSKDVPGMAEVNGFNKRMAEKLGAGRAAGLPPMVQAQMGKGWYEAAKEFAKMEGFNVMTVTRMQSTVDGEVLMVPESQQQSGGAPQVNAGEVAKDAATDAAASQALGRLGRIGGIGGGLGGLRRNKKPAEEKSAPAASSGASGNMVPATTMEMTMEVTSASRGAVDATKFEVPAGYKQVESEMKKMAK